MFNAVRRFAPPYTIASQHNQVSERCWPNLCVVQVALHTTCFQLLGLPQDTWHSIPREQIQAELLEGADKASLAAKSKTLQHSLATCHTSTALFVSPVTDRCSLFSGQTTPEGLPILASAQPNFTPPAIQLNQSNGSARPLNQTLPKQHSLRHSTSHHSGALDVCVGDAVDLTVEVHCSLPRAVSLKDLTLTLGLLQEVTVAYSPKSAGSSRTEFSRTTSSLRRAKAATTDSPTAIGIARTQSGDLASAVTAAADDTDVTTQWQETEELLCQLAQTGNSGLTRATDVSNSHDQQLEGMQASSGAAVLQPGSNQLVFSAHPLKRGLYCLKHMSASLHQLSLHIPAVPRQALHSFDIQQRSPGQDPPNSQATAAVLGTVFNTGQLQQHTVVMNTHSCRQRVAISAAALKSALVAGQPQWLAIAVLPMHDALQEACIHVGVPSQHAHALRANSGNPMAASLGSRSSTASSLSRSLDAAHSAHSFDILDPERGIATPLASEAIAASTQPGPNSMTGKLMAPQAQSSSLAASAEPHQAAFTALPDDEPSSSEAQTGASGQADDGEDMGQRRRDAGAEASTSGSTWVSLEHSHGPNMPRWAASHPSLLWLWAQPGEQLHVTYAESQCDWSACKHWAAMHTAWLSIDAGR